MSKIKLPIDYFEYNKTVDRIYRGLKKRIDGKKRLLEDENIGIERRKLLNEEIDELEAELAERKKIISRMAIR